MIDLSELTRFLLQAKAATYAADGPKAPPVRPNSEDYHFQDGPWVYHDCYWGASSFIGHEVVWHNGTPVWGLNYYGGPTDTTVDASAAYVFLKRALLALDSSVPPLRGPAHFTDGTYVYENKITGDLSAFTGVETIHLNESPVCRHIYHGGLIL